MTWLSWSAVLQNRPCFLRQEASGASGPCTGDNISNWFKPLRTALRLQIVHLGLIRNILAHVTRVSSSAAPANHEQSRFISLSSTHMFEVKRMFDSVHETLLRTVGLPRDSGQRILKELVTFHPSRAVYRRIALISSNGHCTRCGVQWHLARALNLSVLGLDFPTCIIQNA